MDKEKSLKFVFYIVLGFYLLWFFLLKGINQIIAGFTIFLLLLIINSFNKKIKTSQDQASHETFYDAIKFIIFGIFSVIYPALKNVNYVLFILVFVIILYFINYAKIKIEN